MLSEEQGAVPKGSVCASTGRGCAARHWDAPAEPTLSLENATMSDPSAATNSQSSPETMSDQILGREGKNNRAH